MALDLLPKSMLKAIDLLPEAKVPVTLFTRHSIREMVSGQGLAGYDLQLTSQGRELAEAWGCFKRHQVKTTVNQEGSPKPCTQKPSASFK